MERRKCKIEGCNRLTRNKGYYKGKIRYGNACVVHHKRTKLPYFSLNKTIPNLICSQCGWDKAVCDRHRIIPSLGYIPDNVIILCPNCHRLVTLGILII